MIDEISALDYLEKELKEYKQEKCGIHYSIFDKCNIQILKNCIEKQQQYKTIEEELGIDLLTLFKYLKSYDCCTKEKGDCHVVGIASHGIILMPKAFPFGECEFIEDFKDYGKTWALTKEELKEHENVKGDNRRNS